jgi:hypothetical protein
MLACSNVGEDDPRVIQLNNHLKNHSNDASAASPEQVPDLAEGKEGSAWVSPIKRLLQVFSL